MATAQQQQQQQQSYAYLAHNAWLEQLHQAYTNTASPVGYNNNMMPAGASPDGEIILEDDDFDAPVYRSLSMLDLDGSTGAEQAPMSPQDRWLETNPPMLHRQNAQSRFC